MILMHGREPVTRAEYLVRRHATNSGVSTVFAVGSVAKRLKSKVFKAPSVTSRQSLLRRGCPAI
jgi:hypothetical protein